MKSLLLLLLASLLALLLPPTPSLAQQAPPLSDCAAFYSLNQSPGFETTPTAGPFTLTAVLADPSSPSSPSALCVNVTVNNIAGATLQFWTNASAADPPLSAALFANGLPAAPSPLAPLAPLFLPLEPFNRLPSGAPFSVLLQLLPNASSSPDPSSPLLLSMALRLDNADAAVVNATPFSWPPAAPPFQWAGQVFYQDVLPEHSRSECQVFSYAYRLGFGPAPLALPLVASTYGLDTVAGFKVVDTPVPAGTSEILIQGNFTAPKGVFEFRLVAEVLPQDPQASAPSPFSIQLTALSLDVARCERKGSDLTTAQLVGIIVGSVVGFVLICCFAFCVWHKYCRKHSDYESFD